MQFLNRNTHYIYLELPSIKDTDLTRIRAFEVFDVSGADADVAEATPGVVNLAKLTDDEEQEIENELTDRGLALDGDKVISRADLPTAGGLADKNTTELKELAKKAGISGFSKLKKDELIDALEKADEQPAAAGDGDTSQPDPGDTETSKSPAPAGDTPSAPDPLPDPPPKVGKGSSRDDWAKYAKANGIDYPDDAKRADLFKLVDKATKARNKEIKAAGGTITTDDVPAKGR